MRLIMLPASVKKQIAEDLDFTPEFVRRCLNGKHKSKNANMVRKMALERGGVEFQGNMLSQKVENTINSRSKIVDELSELTATGITSVYRWLNGTLNPSPIKKKIIAEYFNTTVEELFPKKEE